MNDPVDLLLTAALADRLGAVSTTPAPANPRYLTGSRPVRSWGAVVAPSSVIANRLAAAMTVLVLAGAATGIKAAATGSLNPFDWHAETGGAQPVQRSIPLCGAPGTQLCVTQHAILTAPPQTDAPTSAPTTAASAPPQQPAVGPAGSTGQVDNGHGRGHGGGGHGHGNGHGDGGGGGDGGSGGGNGEG